MENWTDSYLLRIGEIDKQHQGFFELWENECRNADLNDYEKLKSIIDKLENYILEHFKTEEDLLRKSGYADIESHISQHGFFIQKVSEMKLELNYKNTLLFEKLTMFIKEWFLSHIMQADRKYRDDVVKYLSENSQ
ncbi:Bacteriohemerythrin [anaerobic digester metagenome]